MRQTIAFAALLFILGSAPAAAGHVEKTFDFALDEWFDLEDTDGPVTLHKVRIESVKGGFTKSKFFRPGNDEYLRTIQIELVFSNEGSRDWEARLSIHWKDENGVVIDGYEDKEELDEGERHDKVTVTLSTLAYGIDRARTLHVEIDYDLD